MNGQLGSSPDAAVANPRPPKPSLTGDPTDKLSSLPPVQPIAGKLLALSADADCDVQQIADVVRVDPAISTEILRLANSPLFGAMSRFHTVANAIVFLGVERTKSLAFTAAMKGYMQNSMSNPAVRTCWVHSLACAHIAEELAGSYGLRRDWAYTAGLMHDIGRLGLIKAYGKEYLPLLAADYETIGDSLHDEARLFGFDHCKAGAWLTRVWNFPEELCCAAERHHETFDPHEQDLLQVIQFSCQVADSLGFESIRYSARPTYEQVTGQLPEHIRTRLTQDPEELKARLLKKIDLLQG
jgi:putative nucleotidyltransferase with HDIG domain